MKERPSGDHRGKPKYHNVGGTSRTSPVSMDLMRILQGPPPVPPQETYARRLPSGLQSGRPLDAMYIGMAPTGSAVIFAVAVSRLAIRISCLPTSLMTCKAPEPVSPSDQVEPSG